MAICPSCREENLEGEDVCRNCGADLTVLDLPDSPEAEREAPFMYHRLADVVTRPLSTVTTADPVTLAVRIMQTEEVECVLVMEGDRLAGILTTWDILHKVAGPGEDLFAVTCGQIMTADPVFLRDDDTIAVAINKMAIGGFRHIPLLQGDRPTTVVSIGDVFSHIRSSLT
jgi:CBS domain-containing protein